MNRKKTSARITFLLNLLIALPFTGITAFAAAFLLWSISPVHTDSQFRIFIQALLLDVLFITLWGTYQYRVIFNKKRCLKKMWKVLLISVIISLLYFAVFLLKFS